MDAYYIEYVEGCCPKLKKFQTTQAYCEWMFNFLEMYKDNTDDNYITLVFKGQLIYELK